MPSKSLVSPLSELSCSNSVPISSALASTNNHDAQDSALSPKSEGAHLVFFNLTLKEISALSNLRERAQALTWARLDLDNPLVHQLIWSVDVPEAGTTGADLQKLLRRKSKPARRRTQKPTTKRPSLSSVATDSGLFELLADDAIVPAPAKATRADHEKPSAGVESASA